MTRWIRRRLPPNLADGASAGVVGSSIISKEHAGRYVGFPVFDAFSRCSAGCCLLFAPGTWRTRASQALALCRISRWCEIRRPGSAAPSCYALSAPRSPHHIVI
jgi:hypothetical protein